VDVGGVDGEGEEEDDEGEARHGVRVLRRVGVKQTRNPTLAAMRPRRRWGTRHECSAGLL
jgi:hypothetical protein